MGAFSDVSGAFLESVVFWLYLNYFGLVVKTFLGLPILPSAVWNPIHTTFVCTFFVDYVWRRCLYVGYCTDPCVIIIRFKQNSATSHDVLKYIPMSVAAGTLVFLIGEAVYPVPYTQMDRSKGVLFCFCFEFAFSCLQQTRNALYLLIQNKFLDSAKTSKTDRSHEQLHFYASGLDIMASFVTASLVSIGCYFSPGGPMLHLSYITMASLAARDWFMFLLLGTANLLSGYTAGRYVTLGLKASRCSTIEKVQHSSLLSQAQSSEEKKKHR